MIRNMKKIVQVLAIFITLFVVAPATLAATFRSNDSLTVNENVNDDAFISGQTIAVRAPIKGELWAFGNNVTISEPVERSIFAAGSQVTVDKGAGYNAFIFGGTVTLKGTITHDVYIGGNTVVFDPSTEIKGSVWVGGQNVQLDGKITGTVHLSADTVTSKATIGGNIEGDVSALSFEGGSIGGNLTYRSNSGATGLDKIKVGGKTERLPVRETSVSAWGRGLGRLFTSLRLLSTLVAGAALLLLLPRKVRDIDEKLTKGEVIKSWGTFGLYGLVGLIATPIILAFVASTLVGIPLALIGSAIYFILLYGAMVIGTILVGRWLLRLIRSKVINDWLALVIGIIITGIAFSIPGLGTFFSFIFLIGVIVPVFAALALWWKQRLVN